MSTYIPNNQLLQICPNCASTALVCVLPAHLGLDGCVECLKFWERLPTGEPYTTDGEQLPFKVPCDNCAFRGKSPERTNTERWDDLILQLAHGGEFFCHKAVPFSYSPGEPLQVEKAFEFPKVDKVAVLRIDNLKQASHAYQGYDTERMRLCRGFLNRFVGGIGGPMRNQDGREVTP